MAYVGIGTNIEDKWSNADPVKAWCTKPHKIYSISSSNIPMNTFSKPKKDSTNEGLVWHEYYKNPVNLFGYKVPQLKTIAKYNRLHVTGNKTVLVDRILRHFRLMKAASCIQAYFRRYMVTKFFELRDNPGKGETYVNDTDFYTMDPLREIPFYQLFCYRDPAGFLYGFHLDSLIMLVKRSNTVLMNPYTREKMDVSIIRRITFLYRMINILFTGSSGRDPRPAVFQTTNYSFTNENILSVSRRGDVMRNLEEILQQPLELRIQRVFIEIDVLGNYTQSNWLMTLTPLGCVHLLQNLVDIWNYRSDMSFLVRSQITPYYNPFYFRLNQISSQSTLLNHRRAVTVIENIIFSGGDIEYRKLGAIHILTALTMVSAGAREALPWLYESVVF